MLKAPVAEAELARTVGQMVGQDELCPAHQPAPQGLLELLRWADIPGNDQQFIAGRRRMPDPPGSAGQMNPPGFVHPRQRNARGRKRGIGRLLPQRRLPAGLDPVAMLAHEGTDRRPGSPGRHDDLDPPGPMHADRQTPCAPALAHHPGLRVSVGPKEKLVQFTP